MSMRDLVCAIARAATVDPALVTYSPDPALEASFGRLPLLSTPTADALGFRHDGTIDTLVERALVTLT
jgi:hypothetical protein